MKYEEITSKRYTPPTIDVGDTAMIGKFKNRKATVKGFTKDAHQQPVLKTDKGDVALFKPRISKLDVDEGKLDGVPLLYHASDPYNAVKIIQTGVIKPLTSAVMNGKSVNGLSLTRSRAFASVYNNVVFGFDLNKIRRVFHGRLKPFSDQELGMSDDYHADYRREAEEFLIGRDLPLAGFLVGIWLTSNGPYTLSDDEKAAIEQHPLYKGIMKSRL